MYSQPATYPDADRLAGRDARTYSCRRTRTWLSSGAAGLLALVVGLGGGLLAPGCGGSDNNNGGGGDSGPGPDGSPTDGDGGPGTIGDLTDGLATLSGTSVAGNTDGARGTALFNNPVNVIVAPSGNVIVADFDNSLVRQITPTGDTTTISLPPDQGMFIRPFGLAIVGDSLYIQTDSNSLGQRGGALWRMRLEGGTPALVRDNLGRARGLTAMPDGRLAMADYQAEVVRVFNPSTGQLSLLAGQVDQAGMQNGQGANARFDEPYDIIVMPDGSLLVSDFGNHCLRKVTTTGDVTTFAGIAGEPGQADGSVEDAHFNAPQGLAVAADGTIYVTDTGNFVIRAISPSGQVSTVAGDGSPGFKDSTDPRSGEIYGLEGTALSPDGAYLYIADGNRGDGGPYNRIRRLTLQ